MSRSWRTLDRAIQRDLERAKGTPKEKEAFEQARRFYGTASGAQIGALVGGVIGSVVPVFGTAAGALFGAALGGFIGNDLTKPKSPAP